MVRILEQSFLRPEENLAFDEALLTTGCETLRFWESATNFVVLGRSGKVHKEVNERACEAGGIPVLRRSSGGGAVLLGPGCLNYTLILRLDDRPELMNVARSYQILLGRIAATLAIPDVEVRGSDILFSGRKVSGNAQRRVGGWLLHHGTLIHAMDVALIARLLREPQKQPAHRQGRTHAEFLTILPLSRHEMVDRITAAFSARGSGL
jgi:lipoate---protein ligase